MWFQSISLKYGNGGTIGFLIFLMLIPIRIFRKVIFVNNNVYMEPWINEFNIILLLQLESHAKVYISLLASLFYIISPFQSDHF